MLAIAGGKGGCGKTTTALGLTRALARTGRRPLVVDADREMPDLHVVADVPAVPGLGAVATGTPPPSVAHVAPANPGVSVVPATDVSREEMLTAVDRCRRWDGPVLLDCPAGAGLDAAVPLRAADRTLLVTTAGAPSLRDAAKTAAMSRAVGTPVAGVVVTRARTVPEAVPGLLGCDIAVAVPPAESPLRADRPRRRYRSALARLPRV